METSGAMCSWSDTHLEMKSISLETLQFEGVLGILAPNVQPVTADVGCHQTGQLLPGTEGHSRTVLGKFAFRHRHISWPRWPEHRCEKYCRMCLEQHRPQPLIGLTLSHHSGTASCQARDTTQLSPTEEREKQVCKFKAEQG